MGAFWDDRARENAAYFVENRLDYAAPDLEALWATGPEVLAAYEEGLGYTVHADDEVVEIGCGLGRVTRVLAARARHVHALDVSGEMLARARELNPGLANVTWSRNDGRTLAGLADASADAVFSHVVLQHVPDPAITYAYVTEIGRVLRPGGRAALQVSDDPAVHRARPGIADRARSAAGRGPRGATHPAWLGSAVDLPTLRDTAARAGLTLARATGENTQFCLVLLESEHRPELRRTP